VLTYDAAMETLSRRSRIQAAAGATAPRRRVWCRARVAEAYSGATM